MYSLISQIAHQIAHFLPAASRVAPVNGVAHNLMERAARAGRNPQQAQELRSAAYAYLSVVR